MRSSSRLRWVMSENTTAYWLILPNSSVVAEIDSHTAYSCPSLRALQCSLSQRPLWRIAVQISSTSSPSVAVLVRKKGRRPSTSARSKPVTTVKAGLTVVTRKLASSTAMPSAALSNTADASRSLSSVCFSMDRSRNRKTAPLPVSVISTGTMANSTGKEVPSTPDRQLHRPALPPAIRLAQEIEQTLMVAGRTVGILHQRRLDFGAEQFFLGPAGQRLGGATGKDDVPGLVDPDHRFLDRGDARRRIAPRCPAPVQLRASQRHGVFDVIGRGGIMDFDDQPGIPIGEARDRQSHIEGAAIDAAPHMAGRPDAFGPALRYAAREEIGQRSADHRREIGSAEK